MQPESIPPLLKTCSTCKVVKPVTMFAPRVRGEPQLRAACRDCAAIQNAIYRQIHREELRTRERERRVAHPEKQAAIDARYRHRHPERRKAQWQAWYAVNREQMAERYAAYRAKKREQIRAQRAAYRAANAEKLRKYNAAYHVAHKDVRHAQTAAYAKSHSMEGRDRHHRRRVKLRGGFVEAVDIAVLAERDGGRCGICHKKVNRTERSIDHILPVSKGGAHSYANTRLVHLKCNIARGNREPAQLRMV